MDNALTLQSTKISKLEQVLSLLEVFYDHFNYDYNRKKKPNPRGIMEIP